MITPTFHTNNLQTVCVCNCLIVVYVLEGKFEYWRELMKKNQLKINSDKTRNCGVQV